MLRELRRERGLAIWMVTHHAAAVRGSVDRIVAVEAGAIRAEDARVRTSSLRTRCSATPCSRGWVVCTLCALLGVYVVLRRIVLLGVALPQAGAAGIAFVFF